LKKSAVKDGNYRYSLKRSWDESNPRKAIFIMLNPSTADEYEDDRTTKRCISFAKSWNCGSVEIVNVYAYSSTDFEQLKNLTKEEAIGEDNDYFIQKALRTATIRVVAWGTNVTMHHADYRELEAQLKGYRLFCLGQTSDGHPRHPLFVKKSTQLEVFHFSKRNLGHKKLHLSLNMRKNLNGAK
jgi:hypothetical protein